MFTRKKPKTEENTEIWINTVWLNQLETFVWCNNEGLTSVKVSVLVTILTQLLKIAQIFKDLS